jgi:serine/threonine-protein kinase
MGLVLAARDPDLRRTVAVKTLIDPQRVEPTQLARFVVEAQVTSQLGHPNVVPIDEMGVTPEGLVYFVMRKVEGRALSDILAGLRRGDPEVEAAWSLHRLLTVFVQVCHAIAYAHDRGVLHRDLKPANVMLGEFGQVPVRARARPCAAGAECHARHAARRRVGDTGRHVTRTGAGQRVEPGRHSLRDSDPVPAL